MTTNINDIFETIGFSRTEGEIYQSLLKSGPTSIRTVAYKTGINRGTSYEVLKTLVKKGYVTYTPRGKRKYFTARNPYQLIRTAEKQEQSLHEALTALRTDIVPKLQREKSTHEIADIRYYEGDEGIEQILKDILNTIKNEYYVYSSKRVRKYLYRNFPGFTRQRIKKNIHVRVIAIGEGGEETEMSERKWLKEPVKSESSSYIIIYPPKYALISVTNEDYPYGVVIHEKSIAATQQLIFKSLWNSLPL